jgi:wyosine [tRNA(Phe)-imidazoG37] synthetase (radical SAM superfamily)
MQQPSVFRYQVEDLLNHLDNKHRLIYGPVPSRRLGFSLGVDLVPLKTCSYNCIYCQLGKTEKTTLRRKSYVPTNAILEQLSAKLKEGPPVDHITLGGSGEPTLNDNIGSLIHHIKSLTDIPVAVLTNSSLLGDPLVRQSLLEADVVLPSLDAHDDKGFQAINRPHPDIRFDDMVKGLIAFRQEFRGAIWLEVFVLDGVNATEKDAAQFRKWIEKIRPEKIHVNTSVRPPAETFAHQASSDALARFCHILGKKAEVIASFQGSRKHPIERSPQEELLNILSRRPCTLQDLSSALSVHQNEILKCVDPLVKDGRVSTVRKGSTIYYHIRSDKTAS